ncbi:hypothetical protein CTEN210_16462 [Chaetoceros tenuissimus]|uniref:Methyltransferase domain-containing protein n=1 Tax=Chaetoceros tenuissimus TaxID=426638 RepID=A0AAD3HE54_9STRA|nr:hypothetical protein CTEN210_16462 [Chaetoceros tenuissimus]
MSLSNFLQDTAEQVASTLSKNIKINQTTTKTSESNTIVKHQSWILPSSLALASAAVLATIYKKVSIAQIAGSIYDKIIVDMTKVWYRAVLEQQPDHAVILDVGIGTGGALLQCKDIVQRKKLKIIGVDYNKFYVQAAEKAIADQNMSEYITVHTLDIYDEEALQVIMAKHSIDKFNSVYFSGSFSLMPDPKEALVKVAKVLEPKGKIYITQTYQKKTPPLMTYLKPMIKYVTTIDFGQLVTVEQVKQFFQVENLELEQHSVIDGSLDNYWQAAYITVLAKKPATPNILQGWFK